MQNSQILNECLAAAMFLAAESYSGSAYETSPSHVMDAGCDESFVPVSGSFMANATALVA